MLAHASQDARCDVRLRETKTLPIRAPPALGFVTKSRIEVVEELGGLSFARYASMPALTAV